MAHLNSAILLSTYFQTQSGVERGIIPFYGAVGSAYWQIVGCNFGILSSKLKFKIIFFVMLDKSEHSYKSKCLLYDRLSHLYWGKLSQRVHKFKGWNLFILLLFF